MLAGALSLGTTACNKQSPLSLAGQGGGAPTSAPGTPTQVGEPGGGSSGTPGQGEPPTSEPATTPTEAPPTLTGNGPTSSMPAPTGAPVRLDQSSPEAAAKTFVLAMSEGDGRTLCKIVSAEGIALDALGEQWFEECQSIMTSQMQNLGPLLKPIVKDLSITGATIKGNIATFDKATFTPSAVKDVFGDVKARKIEGKWYLEPTNLTGES